MATKTKSTAITASDMMSGKSNLLSSLDLPTLHTVADYFGVDPEESIEEQVIALTENGVTYATYARAFKIPLPEDYVEDEELGEVNFDEETVEDTGPVTVSRGASLAPQAEYLIKMTRLNPYFEVASVSNNRKVFKFTQDHPYAIMDARTAQFVLEREEGFRQAFPDELADFYED